MYSCSFERKQLYEVVGQVFKNLNLNPRICELGVYDGSNGLSLISTFNPISALFVDSWSSQKFTEEYFQKESLLPGVQPLSSKIFSDYYNGDVACQETWNNLYSKAKEKLLKHRCAQIIKSSTTEAAKACLSLGREFEYIYIDANHRYEHVLRDLTDWCKLLSPLGFIQLNDCTFSEEVFKQGIGVLRALHEFICLNPDFSILAQTYGNFADVLIARSTHEACFNFETTIESSDYSFIRLPGELVFNSSFKNNRMSYDIF